LLGRFYYSFFPQPISKFAYLNLNIGLGIFHCSFFSHLWKRTLANVWRTFKTIFFLKKYIVRCS
jgi:hypothetical protein